MGAQTVIHLTRSALCAAILGLSSPLLATTPPGGIVGQPSLAQLSFVGLPAERLLAGGLSTQQILSAAQRLRDEAAQLVALESEVLLLSNAQSLVKSLQASHDASGAGSPPSPALAAALASLEHHEAAVATARANLRAVVLAGASPSQGELVERALQGAQIGLDGALSLAADTAAMHDQLAVALQAEARSARLGEELDPDYRSLLEAARALPHVAAAAERLTQEWPTLEAALAAPPADGEP